MIIRFLHKNNKLIIYYLIYNIKYNTIYFLKNILIDCLTHNIKYEKIRFSNKYNKPIIDYHTYNMKCKTN